MSTVCTSHLLVSILSPGNARLVRLTTLFWMLRGGAMSLFYVTKTSLLSCLQLKTAASRLFDWSTAVWMIWLICFWKSLVLSLSLKVRLCCTALSLLWGGLGLRAMLLPASTGKGESMVPSRGLLPSHSFPPPPPGWVQWPWTCPESGWHVCLARQHHWIPPVWNL